ncbi:MAG: Arm DNA-binding domain-containing protein, partial [Alphaproteobacteria bacterium]|nr:Arm DNA-binding domain-containing protein [Alphaproteobacteria bacterium]
MTVMKITKSKVDRLKPGDKPIWDTDVKGFGVRVSSTGQKTYVVAYRPKPGGRGINKRFYVIGAHGSPETVESARTEAKSILGRVADGQDPQAEHMAERKREGKTITELVPSFI